MTFDINSAVSSILIRLLIWFYRFLLLKYKLVVKSPMRIIQIAEVTALKFCLQAIPVSKNSARKIKRKEIKSVFSHYKNEANKPDNSEDKITDVLITALINAGKFLGGEETTETWDRGAWIPNGIEFSKKELILNQGLVGLTCSILIFRNKTYWMSTNPYPRNSSFGEDADKVNAIVEIPGLNEFIELLESAGMEEVTLS